MWNGVGFGDTRLSSSKVAMRQWWEKVLNKNSRFLLRIGDCDPRPYHNVIRAKEESKFASKQQTATTSSGVAAIAGFDNYNLGLEYFSSNPCSLYLLYEVGAIAIAIAFFYFLLMRSAKRRNGNRRGNLISPPFDAQYSNYGSLK